MQKHLKRILIDMAGFGLIIASPFLGWLPGPGGIPMLIAGLALLSINNKWAKTLLDYTKKHADSALDIIFPDKKSWRIAHTICGICLLILSFWAFSNLEGFIRIAIAMPALGIGGFQLIYANKSVVGK
ncbi:MAG: hypothetical protein MUF85_00160 [Patescibacteria group bacterium]|jgi:hypothetical protein|nr:hypothetical protein [Patescibacteria group bacterium]